MTAPQIKAIPTKHHGVLFRSRTEARWAVFFDALGFTWEYERDGYALPSGRYLPDFWLPRQKWWIEIKGQTPTGTELDLICELEAATKARAFMLCGVPALWPADFYTQDHPEGYAVRADGTVNDMCWWMACPRPSCGELRITTPWGGACNWDHDTAEAYVNRFDHPDLVRAVDAARSARFGT